MENHATPIAGHIGLFKTYQKIRQSFFWKGMKKEVQKFIAECTTCQANKHENSLPAGLLQPLPIPHQKWEDITMDFITGLSISKGKDTIFVIVDRLTKYAHFIAIQSTFNAPRIVEIFIKENA